MFKKIKSWWKNRLSYNYRIDIGRNKLYDAYYYPNVQSLQLIAPQHIVDIHNEGGIKAFVKCIEAEMRTAFAKAHDKPLKVSKK